MSDADYACLHLRLPYSSDKWLNEAIRQANERDNRMLYRPFILLKPRVFIDGDQWCALYGDNLQDGVAGFGDSPELAALDFDLSWRKKLPSREGASGE